MTAETANDAASAANAAARPERATSGPPSAGPIRFPPSVTALAIALPACSSPGGSSDGSSAYDGEMNSPSLAPVSPASGPSASSVLWWPNATAASAPTSTHRAASATSISGRAPTRSDSTPLTGISAVRGTP